MIRVPTPIDKFVFSFLIRLSFVFLYTKQRTNFGYVFRCLLKLLFLLIIIKYDAYQMCVGGFHEQIEVYSIKNLGILENMTKTVIFFL